MQKPGNNIFVYAVCGVDKHIQTLNFSLKYLKHFSRNEIIVVTDLSRNDLTIEHDNILNIDTPREFNHHQASIYLKTNLHKILDLKQTYCYLDSDVIAVNNEVDEVFNYKSGPVTFASDHCLIAFFSPYAINCNCYNPENVDLLNKLIEEYKDKFVPKDPELLKKYIQLERTFRKFDAQLKKIEKNKLTHKLLVQLKKWKSKTKFMNNVLIRKLMFWLLPGRYNLEKMIQINGNFKMDDNNRYYDEHGNLIFDTHNNYRHYISRNSTFIWDEKDNTWVDESGQKVYTTKCNHLIDAIKNKFNIIVNDKKWPHWNGGVFLFDRLSCEFMDTWHNYTMDIFKDKNWKTRDQGTLIATAWKYGLQNNDRLPPAFNFLADYYNPDIEFSKEKGFSLDNFKTTINPSFIHVYHEFGRKGWDVWNYIEELFPENKETAAVDYL